MNNVVLAVSTDTGEVTAIIGTEPYPMAIAGRMTGSRAYVTYRDSGNVLVIDTKTDKAIATIAALPKKR